MAQLRPEEIASLLQQQGVAREKIPTMVAIAQAESSGRSTAFNPTGLDKSYGLFQVNMYGGLGPARMKQFGLKSEQELFDPVKNVRAAKEILGNQGLGAWTTYTSGKYKQFLPQAQQAAKGTNQQPTERTTPTSNEFLAVFADQINKQNQILEAAVRSKKEKSEASNNYLGSWDDIPTPQPINPQALAVGLMQTPNSYV